MKSYCMKHLADRSLLRELAYYNLNHRGSCADLLARIAEVAGRVHLTAVSMLAPHLSPGSIEELLAGATHKTKPEIELLLAGRFPRPDLPTVIQPITSTHLIETHAPEQVMPSTPQNAGELIVQLVPEPVWPLIQPILDVFVAPLATCEVPLHTQRAKIVPLAPGRVGIQVTVSESTHEKLRHA